MIGMATGGRAQFSTGVTIPGSAYVVEEHRIPGSFSFRQWDPEGFRDGVR